MKNASALSEFQRPMKPYPGLENLSRRIWLPKEKINIFFYDLGGADKPTALLLHGLGDEADTWHRLIQPISHSWRVIAPDLPGFGRSDGASKKYNESFFLSVLLELLDVIGIERALLMGHSLGAVLSHRIALEHPDLASGLILIGGSAIIKPKRLNLGSLLFMIPGIGERLYRNLRKDPQAAYRSLLPYFGDINQLPDVDREFLYQRVNERVWSDTQMAAYFSTLRNFGLQAARQPKALRDRLKALRVPTLVFWGEKDAIYSPEGGIDIANLQPDARMVTIPGAGHNAHQEKPEIILDEIIADLRLNAG